MRYKSLLAALLILTAALSLTACSDDPASSDLDEEAPVVPAAVTALEQIDLSFFEVDEIEFSESNTAFTEAMSYSMTAMMTTVFSSSFTLMFTGTSAVEPELQNGKWVWTYTMPVEDFEDDDYLSRTESPVNQHLASLAKSAGSTMTMTMIAEPVSGGTKWSLYVSGNFNGEAVTDFLFLEGYISDDETVGEWKLYSAEFSEPALTASWELGADEFSFTTELLDGDEVIKITFEGEQDENWIEFSDSTEHIRIYWNDATGLGYIENGDERNCFSRDSNYENVPCAA